MSDPRTKGNIPSPEDLALSVGEVALSCYCPSALTHLPQPVPSDLPPDLDPRIFTFQDAFEDLLAVSQGKSLPTIDSRYHQSRMLRQMYPQGEPTWLWIGRLQSQGLIRPPRESYIVRASREGWEDLQKDLEESAREFWRELRENPKSREAVRETGKLFRELHDQFSGSSNSLESRNRDQGPENFDDLFSAIQSAYADGRSAWDAFRKTLNEELPRRMGESERQMEGNNKDSSPSTSTGNTRPNPNEKETRSEWVDAFGYKHTTIKRMTYDENGQEIGSSTSITIRPAKHEKPEAVDNGKGSIEADSKTNGGWFW
ncbi:hypothetical protein V2A60_007017 [Cordyceps javanica]|uniref:Uncharacterized protein n=1 Tax=Cordyceps javanica TaxID=43265 RepID=A0A545US71_9HYPO|nr:hypothetical protein IF1G_08846 [Cordyceps javanica]TQW04429.1 hypothetical protein IF2G_08199 [Cordyceps javanica]